MGLFALALALTAGVCFGAATHRAYQWSPSRLQVAIGVGVAAQAILLACGPDWHFLAQPPLAFAREFTGGYRIGLVFVPAMLVSWARPIGRFGAALLGIAGCLVLGIVSFPFDVAIINLNGSEIAHMNDYLSAILLLIIPVGLGVGIGRTFVQHQVNSRSRAGTT